MDNLSNFYIEKARTKLNETETRKEQSIMQFYEWLSKHPFVKKCDIEPFQIVILLRARKYNMQEVYEKFNNFICIYKSFPELVNFLNCQKLLEIYDKGPFLIMKNRDSNGRRILILRQKIIEDSNVHFVDIIKTHMMVGGMMASEIETHINGNIVIIDFRGVTLNYLKIFDLNVVGKLITMSNSHRNKTKQIIILGLPAFANSIFEIFKSFLTEKMKKRIKLCKNVDELAKIVNVKDLTVEYGGPHDADECLKEYRKEFEKQIEIAIKLFNSIEIDEKKFKLFENEKNLEVIGSFRKLEID